MAIITDKSCQGWAQNGREAQRRASPHPGNRAVTEGFLEQEMFKLLSEGRLGNSLANDESASTQSRQQELKGPGAGRSSESRLLRVPGAEREWSEKALGSEPCARSWRQRSSVEGGTSGARVPWGRWRRAQSTDMRDGEKGTTWGTHSPLATIGTG